jgi:fatty-acyl-CoA synthase
LERAQSEWTFLRGLLRTLRRTTPIARNRDHTLRDLVEELAAKYGDRIALQSDTEQLTYRELNARSNRYARWARDRGVGKGDVVALLMPNRPDYLAVWFGFAKIGAVTALINTNLSAAPLAHSLNTVGARIILADATLLDRYATALPFLTGSVELVVHGANEGDHARIDEEIELLSGENLPADERVPLTINDRCIFVYTSGTTGLPKAANLNHYRVQLIMQGFAAIADSTAADRVYDCLPMYHSNGGVIAPGIAMIAGGTCIIRERFSAREFWPDIQRHRATVFVYIGELCRYLLNTPPSPADRDHAVRLCVGNGLRPDVWLPFRNRFGLPSIIEFYAATEGNCSMFNLDSHPGAVGRIPGWIKSRFPMRIVAFDVDRGEVVRGPDGFCREVPDGEVGELIGEIVDDPKKPGNRFEGYSERRATEEKILRDVFRKGDAWFRTGDLMRRDERGYHYFVDRIGDTFRWKGENVSTTEVAEAIASFPSVRDVTVFGVALPGREGRAGMAAMVVADPDAFDFQAFDAFLKKNLPDYAQPLFLRLVEHLDLTGTFKQRKTDLARAGIDPAAVADPLYMRDPERAFAPLDRATHARLVSGAIRL